LTGLNIEHNELLRYMLDNDIINLDIISNEYNMKKRQGLLERHTYEIWQGQNGSWYTYLPEKEKGRVLKKRKSEKDIEDIIVEYYEQAIINPRIEEVFEQWIDKKLLNREIKKQSYDRYKTDYARFFGNCDFKKMRMQSIEEDDIEEFIRKSIYEFELTKKTYAGLRTLIYGIFKYAKKKKYTKLSITNFFGDLELSKNVFTQKVKENDDQVFSDEEVDKITSYLKSNRTIWNLGVLLVFQTGIRVGELAALRKEDILPDAIKIRRTEIKYKDEETNKWTVGIQEFTKTGEGIRDVFITDSTVDTLNSILESNPEGKYLFENNGKRIRENTFSKRIVAVCGKLGIKPRSIHKVRATYGTTLLDAEVDESVITGQMGHRDIETTRRYYYYSTKSNSKKSEQIKNAILI